MLPLTLLHFGMRKLILLILVLLPSSLFADELTQALKMYERGDFVSAKPLLDQLAEQGNPKAQYQLAFMHFNGDGVPRNEQLAAAWFKRAAKQGYAAAQDTLAYMYLNGRGMDADPVQAYAWYSLAADNGIFLARQIIDMLEQQLDNDDLMQARRLAQELQERYGHH